MPTMPSRGVVLIAFVAGVLSTPLLAHEPTLPDPLDPYAPVTQTHYHPVLNRYRTTPIVNRPANWRELNDRAERIGGPLGQLRDVNEPIREKKRK